jgi:uncharacterized membrane protein YdfJ with MMPL/SSD domain
VGTRRKRRRSSPLSKLWLPAVVLAVIAIVTYTSVAVLLLETKGRKLGEQDHQYYNEVVRRLLDDTKNVASVQDLWGKPVTMSGSQSADAEATTLTIRPVGDLGSSKANESIEAIRDIVAKVPKPDGLTAYITGPAPLAADTLHATDSSLVKLTIVTVILIVILLLIAYRSITIALIPLFGVLTTLAVARGIIIGQAGVTICMGLMLDMLVVRLFLVMPLARLLGPWFWWPQRIEWRPREAPATAAASSSP